MGDTAEFVRARWAAPQPARSPLTAALLNLTGLGLGYAYLGRRRRQVLHLLVTVALVVIAFVTGAAALPWLWVVVAVCWLGWMAVDGWRVAAARFRRRSSVLPVAVAVLAIGAVVPGYELVSGVYELTLSGDVARADAGRAECVAFATATDTAASGDFAGAVELYRDLRRAHPGTALAPFVDDSVRGTYERWGTSLRAAGDHGGAVRVYRDLLDEVGDGPGAPRARAELADTLVEEADELRAQLPGLTGPSVLDALRTAMDDLLSVQREFADAPSAPGVAQRIADTHTAARTQTGCDALPVLDHAVGLPDAGVAGAANADRVRALFDCGLQQYDSGGWADSGATFDRLVAEYPDDPATPQARANAIAAEVSEVTGTLRCPARTPATTPAPSHSRSTTTTPPRCVCSSSA